MFYNCHLVVLYMLCSCRAVRESRMLLISNGCYEVTNTVPCATVAVVTAAVACTTCVGLVPYYTTSQHRSREHNTTTLCLLHVISTVVVSVVNGNVVVYSS